MKMLALTKYGRQAASTRQRLMQYEPFLASAGIEITYAPLLDNAHVERIAKGARSNLLSIAKGYGARVKTLVGASDIDLIWLHCEAFPFLPAFFERLVRRPGVPIILDYDDAIFHMYDHHASSLVRRTLGRKLETTIAQASAVVAGNDYLGAYARRINPNVHIVPTVVDTRLYRPHDRDREGPVVVGWIGSPSTWRYVEPLLPTLLDVTRSAGAVFRAVGGGPQAARWSGVEAVDWSEATEIQDVQAMDIGIMPIPDEPWARGKCGYKLIQYMACGLPVIASPVGVNRRIVGEGVNGFLAEDAAQWASALSRLLADGSLRARLGQAGRDSAERDYSLAAYAAKTVDIVRETGAMRSSRL